jgi:hypothetical protein
MIHHLLCWKGFAVAYYSFTLSALQLEHHRLSLSLGYSESVSNFNPPSKFGGLILDMRYAKLEFSFQGRNWQFFARSRHAKQITAGIYLIFRGLFFEHNAEIAEKGHLCMETD